MTTPPGQTRRVPQGKVALWEYSPACYRLCGATTRDTSDPPDPTVDRLRARESSDLCSWRTRLGSIPFFITGGVPQEQMQLLVNSNFDYFVPICPVNVASEAMGDLTGAWFSG